ncbi:MAG: HepT-like ribonuclease domain-containing protein [Mucilaginibacter sp.]
MLDRRKKFYKDILDSILLIHEFLGPINLFEQYTIDRKTKSAIERQLSIIGEAVKRIKEIDPNDLINYHKDIIGFRNILVHNYDDIDDNIVWSIIKHHLVALKEDVIAKLNTNH